MLSLDRYPGDVQQAYILEKLNIGFSIIFFFETTLKLLGLGFRGYFLDNYNIFDLVIVIASIVDLFISSLMNLKAKGVITALRSFRLMRVFKLAK